MKAKISRIVLYTRLLLRMLCMMYGAVAGGMSSSSAPLTAKQRGLVFKDESRNACFFCALPARVYGFTFHQHRHSSFARLVNELAPRPRCSLLPWLESQHHKWSLYSPNDFTRLDDSILILQRQSSLVYSKIYIFALCHPEHRTLRLRITPSSPEGDDYAGFGF